MAEDSRVNTSDVLPPSYLQVRWARGGCAGVGGGGARWLTPRWASRPSEPVMERELTGRRDGRAWKSHQINDGKFSGGKSRCGG